MASFSRRLNQLSAQLDRHHQSIRPVGSLVQPNAGLSIKSDLPNLRSSASLIIIQPLQSITPDGYNYRTLLIQRNSTQRSFSAAHVFPGGNLDQDDHNYHPFLNRRASKDKANEPSDLQIALKLCAIRETFEETGILTGLSPGVDIPSSILTDFRQKLTEQTGTHFTSIMQHIQDRVPSTKNNQDSDLFCLDQLSHHANILTPTTSPKRWDTHFYLTILPPHSDVIARQNDMHIATPDKSETISVVWLSPAEALKQSVLEPSEQSDSITLPPPQFYLLTDLARWKDYRQLMDHTSRKVFPLTPEIVKQKSEGTVTFFVVFPGDPLHSASEELYKTNHSVDKQSVIHRIQVRHEATNFGSQPGNFFRPMRLHRSQTHKLFGKGWEDLD